MLYVIYAAENIYGGLHGMCDYSIYDCDSLDEVREIGYENGLEVINTYGCICEDLEEELQESIDLADDTLSEEAVEELRAEIYNEDVDYNFWKIKEEIAGEYSVKEMEEMLYNDPEYFIEKYCEDIL